MIQEIEISKLLVHPKNVRKTYNDIEELAESIKAQGILQNLTVVPNPEQEGTYLTVIGNRRLTAAKMAGLKTAPCFVTEMDEKEQASVMMLENMQRNDLTIYEQAQGFQLMLDLGETEDTIAEKTGFSKTTIRHRLNIAKLDQEKLQEREADGNFQLSLKDLYALEKVADIEKRNQILSEARDSRDLAWRAQSAVTDAKRQDAAKKIIEMLFKIGAKVAPDKVQQEIYTNKWKTVATYDLDAEVPENIEIQEEGELFFLKYYREIKVVKLAPKVKKEETEEDRKKKELEKNKKQIKEIQKEMLATVREFILNITTGKVEALKEKDEPIKKMWGLLLDVQAYASADRLIAFYFGKSSIYDVKKEDKEAEATKQWVDGLTMIQQMLIIVHNGILQSEIVDYYGTYNEKTGRKMQRLYEILALYGLHIDDEEQKKVLDGTSEYYKQPDMAEDEPGVKGLCTFCALKKGL